LCDGIPSLSTFTYRLHAHQPRKIASGLEIQGHDGKSSIVAGCCFPLRTGGTIEYSGKTERKTDQKCADTASSTEYEQAELGKAGLYPALRSWASRRNFKEDFS
jgi:hypothetical protein